MVGCPSSKGCGKTRIIFDVNNTFYDDEIKSDADLCVYKVSVNEELFVTFNSNTGMSIIDPDERTTTCMTKNCSVTVDMFEGNPYYAILESVTDALVFNITREVPKDAPILAAWEITILAILGVVILLLLCVIGASTILYRRTAMGKGYSGI